jgi:hypothetical protein
VTEKAEKPPEIVLAEDDPLSSRLFLATPAKWGCDSEPQFSHRICPDCCEKFVRPELKKLNKTGGNP